MQTWRYSCYSSGLTIDGILYQTLYRHCHGTARGLSPDCAQYCMPHCILDCQSTVRQCPTRERFYVGECWQVGQ